VDHLEKNALVLELVTLAKHVKSMVNVLINFLGVTHLLEKTTKNADTTHPKDLHRETCVGSTLTLSDSSVSSLPLSLVSDGNSGTGMYNNWLLNDESITMKTGDVTTGIGKRNLVNLIGVKPDLLLTAL